MKKITTVALILISMYAKAGSCVANGTGSWEAAATWSCGHIPGTGDNVTIDAGKIVTVNANNTTAIGNLDIFGTLQFTNGAKITLTASSVVNVDPGGSITGGNGGAKLVFPSASYSGPFATAGPFYFSNGGSGSGILPLTMVSFNYSKQDNQAILYWKTENEVNINSFEIESSRNGNSGWQSLEIIPAMAAYGSGYAYTYVDRSKMSGDTYYRLKIVDNDGKYAYSKILYVNSNESTTTNSIKVTPAYSSMNVILPASGSAQISIFNTAGQLVKTLTTENEIFNVDVSNLTIGMYFIRASQGKNLYTAKFVKQ